MEEKLEWESCFGKGSNWPGDRYLITNAYSFPESPTNTCRGGCDSTTHFGQVSSPCPSFHLRMLSLSHVDRIQVCACSDILKCQRFMHTGILRQEDNPKSAISHEGRKTCSWGASCRELRQVSSGSRYDPLLNSGCLDGRDQSLELQPKNLWGWSPIEFAPLFRQRSFSSDPKFIKTQW